MRDAATSVVNGMCISCARLGVDCRGTRELVWTGCVHHTTELVMTITVTRQQSSNYTPSDLMHKWAKENGGYIYHTPLGSARLVYHGAIWKYDHWKIDKNKDGTETVQLHLTAESKKQIAPSRSKT